MKTNPIVAKTETVEVYRAVKLSLNNPSIVEMTAADAVRQRMFETSHGTMDVSVTIKTGPHSGCQAYLDGAHVRARTEYAAMTKQRTGNAPGQGRQPTITPVGERAESLHVRVSQGQRAKVVRNGGGQWVRALIDAAPETASLPNQPSN